MEYTIKRVKKFRKLTYLISSNNELTAKMNFFGFKFKNAHVEFDGQKWKFKAKYWLGNKITIKRELPLPKQVYSTHWAFYPNNLLIEIEGKKYIFSTDRTTEKIGDNSAQYYWEDEKKNEILRLFINHGFGFTYEGKVIVKEEDHPPKQVIDLLNVTGFYLIHLSRALPQV